MAPRRPLAARGGLGIALGDGLHQLARRRPAAGGRGVGGQLGAGRQARGIQRHQQPLRQRQAGQGGIEQAGIAALWPPPPWRARGAAYAWRCRLRGRRGGRRDRGSVVLAHGGVCGGVFCVSNARSGIPSHAGRRVDDDTAAALAATARTRKACTPLHEPLVGGGVGGRRAAGGADAAGDRMGVDHLRGRHVGNRMAWRRPRSRGGRLRADGRARPCARPPCASTGSTARAVVGARQQHDRTADPFHGDAGAFHRVRVLQRGQDGTFMPVRCRAFVVRCPGGRAVVLPHGKAACRPAAAAPSPDGGSAAFCALCTTAPGT